MTFQKKKGVWFFILFCHLFLCQILADATELLKSITNLGSPILENPLPEVHNPLSPMISAFLPLWWQFHHRPCNMWQCWWLWWWQRPLWWQFHPRPCPWTWTVSPGAFPPPWTQRRRACRQSFFIQLRSISFNCLDSSRKMWDKNCTCPISFFIQ